MDRAPVEHRSARACPADQRERELTDRPDREWAVFGDEQESVDVPAVDGGISTLPEETETPTYSPNTHAPDQTDIRP
jgi:hypothetical protein